MKNNRKTKFFLDSVMIDEIRKYSWLISGVTTTPTFFKRENVDYENFVSNFRKEFPDLELHIEALGPTPEDTEEQLKEIINKEWFDPKKVVIKIPADLENLRIVSKYSKQNIMFNTHLIFNPSQAYLASISGTSYVCPLIGRYADNVSKLIGKNMHGGDGDIGIELLNNVIDIVDNSPRSDLVRVMASSIRTVEDFHRSVLSGADVVTVPTKILELSIENEYTNQGIQTFLSDMGF